MISPTGIVVLGAGVLVALIGVILYVFVMPRHRQQRRRLRDFVTRLVASDPALRVETLERVHALAPRDRAALAGLLRERLTTGPRGSASSSPAEAMTRWFLRQIMSFLNDARAQVRMDAARTLQAIMGGDDPLNAGVVREWHSLSAAVTAAAEMAGGRVLSGMRQSRSDTRVLAFAELLEAGLRPLAVGIQAIAEGREEDLEELNSALRDRSPQVRRSLCEVLAAMGGERGIEMLLPLLQDPSPELRARATQALGSLKASAAAEQVTALLDDPVGAVRAAAAATLAEMATAAASAEIVAALAEESRREDRDEDALSEMIEAAAGLSQGASEHLARALASLPRPVASRLAAALERKRAVDRWLLMAEGDSRATAVSDVLASAARLGVSGPFLEALDSTDERVRMRAAEALGHSRDPEALKAVAALLNDPDGSVRRGAVTSLARRGQPVALPPLSTAAADPDGTVRVAALIGLKEVLAERSQWRSEMLPSDFDLDRALAEAHRALSAATRDSHAAVRREAAHALGSFSSPEAAQGLVDLALADADEQVREAATEGLARCGFPHTQRLLVAALEDTDDLRRAAAMTVLGALGGAEAGRYLADALHDPVPRVREAAVASLSGMDLTSLTGRLTPELRSPDPRVRAAVAALLGKARAPEAVASLVQALADPEEEVRVNALQGIAGLGQLARKHQGALTARTTDPSRRVREAAEAALEELRTTWSEAADATDALRPGPLSGAAADALVEATIAGDPDLLLRALETRESAQSLARYLGGPGGEKLSAVLAALRQTPERDQVRAGRALARALLSTGGSEAYLAQLKALDSEVRLMAVEIAGRMETGEAVAALLDVLAHDPVPELRTHAASLLGNVEGETARAALLRAQSEDQNEIVRLVASRALSRRQGAPEGVPVSPPTDEGTPGSVQAGERGRSGDGR